MSQSLTERNSEIIGMRLAGQYMADIGRQMGLSRERVRQIIVRELGRTYAEDFYWSESEDAALRDLWNAGAHSAHIADNLGRTVSAVRRRARILDLEHRNFRAVIWDGKLDGIVRRGYRAGKHVRVIASELTAIVGFPVTRDAIIGRAHRLNLVHAAHRVKLQIQQGA